MEFIIPAVALGTLYIVSNQEKIKKESFVTNKLGDTWKSSEYPYDTKKNLHDGLNSFTNPNQRQESYNTKETAEKYHNKNCNNEPQIDDKETFTSLTGESIETKDIEHNNMVPFFGSHVTQSTNNFNRSEGILDNMTGSGSQTIKKGEVAPLFKPKPDMQWGFGMPNYNDFIQSRQNPSQKMSNVKLFTSERVGPGLNKGYTSQPSGGFNSGMEARDKWMEKPVVTQRTTTHKGMFLPGKHPVSNIGIEGKVEKNRPDRFFIHSPERYFTTTGQEKRQTSRGVQVFKPENRPTTTKEYFGSSNHESEAPAIRGNYRQSTKPVGKALKFTPAYSPETGKIGKEGYKNRPNERSLTSETNFLGGAGTVVSALIAPINDILRPSRKENVIGNARPVGNAHRPAQYPTYNPADKTRTTMKETTSVNKFPMYKNRGDMQSGGYNKNTHQPTITHRNSTNCGSFGTPGNLSSLATLYDTAYSTELNENKERLLKGRAPAGNTNLSSNNQRICMKKRDCDRVNQRGFAPQMISKISGTKESIGKLSRKVPLKQDINCQRNSSEILKAFNSNPYTQSLKSVA